MELPNEIDINKIEKLLLLSNKQDICIFFRHNITTVSISRDGVDLFDTGGNDGNKALDESIGYLQRVNRSEVQYTSIEKLQKENEQLKRDIQKRNDFIKKLFEDEKLYNQERFIHSSFGS